MNSVRELVLSKTKANYIFSYKNSKVELKGSISCEMMHEKLQLFSDLEIEEWQFKLSDYVVYFVAKFQGSWIRMIRICDMRVVHKITCTIL